MIIKRTYGGGAFEGGTKWRMRKENNERKGSRRGKQGGSYQTHISKKKKKVIFKKDEGREK